MSQVSIRRHNGFQPVVAIAQVGVLDENDNPIVAVITIQHIVSVQDWAIRVEDIHGVSFEPGVRISMVNDDHHDFLGTCAEAVSTVIYGLTPTPDTILGYGE